MPRRRASKGHGRPAKGKDSSSVVTWDKRDEIPLDEVDQFHEQRDKILLDGDGDGDDDDDLGENEVFALRGLDESDDDDDEYGEEEDELEDFDEPKESKKKSKKTKTKGKVAPESSSSSESGEEEEEESWGGKKSAYYSSNAAQIESDDEEAHEMEEQEARRLQAKQRENLREEDFAYNEAPHKSGVLPSSNDIWGPTINPLADSYKLDKRTTLKQLERTNPEALALAYDWDDTARALVRIKAKLTDPNTEKKGLGLIHVHFQTLQTYAALLAFYLHLRASPKYASHPEELRTHAIMTRLVTLKQCLQMFEELGFNISDSESDLDELESDDFYDDFGSDSQSLMFKQLTDMAGGVGISPEELQELIRGEMVEVKEQMSTPPSPGRREKAKDKLSLSGKKRKVEKQPQRPDVVFDLEEPTLPKAGPSKPESRSDKHSALNGFSSFGEATSLDDTDVAEKGARKKALRFHTAKIESAAARRQGARNALGGDDDVPYRQRKKELGKNARIRKDLGAGGDDLDDEDPETRQHSKRPRQDDAGSDSSQEDEDGYYSLVKRQKKEKKAAKKSKYEEEKAEHHVAFSEDAAEGQRSISRAILKNKGLTPRRSKSVRNPRVKKRMKFEKAKKKVSSQKAIYKGGIGDANHYSGETTGISKVVKSVRL